MRLLSAMAALAFVLAAVVQLNDPDPALWVAAYVVAAATAVAAFFGRVSVVGSLGLGLLYGAAAWAQLPGGADAGSLSLTSFSMASLRVEEAREALGLGVCAVWMLLLAFLRPQRATVALLLLAAWGCAGRVGFALPTEGSGAKPATAIATDASSIVVGEALERRLVPRERVATGLANPRGMLVREDGLLVSLAGDGDPSKGDSGALLLLRDRNGDGHFEDEQMVFLDRQPSRNVLDVVRRDEVFGMAGIAEGGGRTLASLAFFGGPSTIWTVEGTQVVEWSRVFGNINDLAYDPTRDVWFAVSSSSDEVVRLQPERGSVRIKKIPSLAGGQDPVPGYLRHDPVTGDLLVSLFSGSTHGEEGGTGLELVAGAGGIVRLDPDDGSLRWLVTGLTAPTDLEVGPDGRLYVLEFCRRFEDPVGHREALWARTGHGGFRRFSGRLLAIDRGTGTVDIVAEGLDGPTNLAIDGSTLYVAQGMGTPGRPIPGPDGRPVPLTGFIDRLVLVTTEDDG